MNRKFYQIHVAGQVLPPVTSKEVVRSIVADFRSQCDTFPVKVFFIDLTDVTDDFGVEGSGNLDGVE